VNVGGNMPPQQLQKISNLSNLLAQPPAKQLPSQQNLLQNSELLQIIKQVIVNYGVYDYMA
jgi:hypothetical protein